jgi:CO dehydrogenase/acetyl-CoA synthase delta subunit
MNTDKPSPLKKTCLSSSGVTLMPAMDTVKDDCGDTGSGHEKPGYTLCPYVDGFITTDTGPVPRIRTALSLQDRFSTFIVRCGINRNQYRVAPGLYGVGQPDKTSEVLVTANFKLTFDHLRKELTSLNAWILVLDTQGINVWCAAGERNLCHPGACQQNQTGGSG